jgi:hypothetical protein
MRSKFEDIGVEIVSPEGKDFTSDEFHIICETLERVGIANFKKKELYQSVHILHRKGKYRLIHFKEAFLLEGKTSAVSKEDIERRNYIIHLMQLWGLIKATNIEAISQMSNENVTVLQYKERDSWTTISKYNVGKKDNG